MSGFIMRCSALGKIMTEPRSKADGPLSAGAKSFIREQAAQEIRRLEAECWVPGRSSSPRQ